MFKFWKKRDSSSARRTTKVWVMRAKKLGLVLGVIALVGFSGFYAWKNGVFGAFGEFVYNKSLTVTAGMGFRVNDILITGRRQISQSDLLTHIDIREGQPIFSVSLQEAQQSLSGISWVEQAAVSRRLPGTIVIDIRERTPVALWQYQKKVSVIDVNGQPLTTPNVAAWQHLPLVVGQDAPKHVTEILSLMQAEPDIAEQLDSAVRIGDRRWDLRLKNGMLVKLPEENVGLALRQLAQQQETQDILAKNIMTIDLRIPEKFVVEVKTTEGAQKPKADI